METQVYAVKFAKKQFTADNMKAAYMKAVKWVANNVLSKDELQDTLVKYEKDEQYPTVTVHLFVEIPEKEIRKRHCEICKESHAHFYINEHTNCDWCNCKAYQRRTDDMLKNKRRFYHEQLKKYLEV